jgi:hypothetical protein
VVGFHDQIGEIGFGAAKVRMKVRSRLPWPQLMVTMHGNGPSPFGIESTQGILRPSLDAYCISVTSRLPTVSVFPEGVIEPLFCPRLLITLRIAARSLSSIFPSPFLSNCFKRGSSATLPDFCGCWARAEIPRQRMRRSV